MSLEASSRRSDAALAAIGMVVLGFGMVVDRKGTVPSWERRIFHPANDLPGFLYPMLWPVQQVGASLVVAVLAMFLQWLKRRWLAAAVLAAGVSKLVLERVVKAVVCGAALGLAIAGTLNVIIGKPRLEAR